MKNIDILKEVEQEVKRFNKKLVLAIKEQSNDANFSSRHFASVKRSAFDLKNELTKLTQSSKYKYNY